MMNFFKKIVLFLIGIFRCDTTQEQEYKEFLKGKHECSVNMLLNVMPQLDQEQVVDAFKKCCNLYPYDGVTNKEFNIALRYLKIFDKFEYDDSDGFVVQDFLERKRETFILLIHGHFTIVMKGRVLDAMRISEKSKVYCSWKLRD